MKLLKKKSFWAVLAVLAVIIVLLIMQKTRPAKEELVTAKAMRGNLIQTVSATGQVESASETNLNFSITGRLTGLLVKAGQVVKTGQLLAQLDGSQAASKVASARAKVKEAEADLEKVKAGASIEDVAVSRQTVASAKSALEAARLDLANTLALRGQSSLNFRQDLLIAAGDSVFVGQKSLSVVYDVMTSSHKKYYGNTKPQTYYQVEKDYPLVKSAFAQLSESSPVYSVSSSLESLTALAEQTLGFLGELDGLLSNIYEMLSNTSAPDTATESAIDVFIANIATERGKAATQKSTVQSAKADLAADNLNYQQSVDAAQAKVEKAENDLALAKAQLSLKEAGPRSFEISYYEARLLNTQADLQAALADLADYSLRSPLAGLVTETNYEVGEFVSSAKAVVTLIGESNLEIKLDVPESDIAKIKAGDSAVITLDAFSDEQKFNGHLSFIDPAATVINEVVYYQVKVSFDQAQAMVKPGMTANVTVKAQERENVLFVPTRAILEKDGQKIVRVLLGEQKQEKTVTTGLKADEGLTEIISGLEEGETVITYIKNGK